MGLEAHVAALVATFDLEVVRLLRDAMRTADIAGALQTEARILRPAAIYEPRRRIESEPIFEPRRQVQEKSPARSQRVSPVPITPLEIRSCESNLPDKEMTATPSPVQPPWKTLVWENKPAPAPLKITIIRPDILVSKGSVLDLFI